MANMGRCPSCDRIASLDDDQLAGRVSVVCPWPDCDFHGYVRDLQLLKEAKRA